MQARIAGRTIEIRDGTPIAAQIKRVDDGPRYDSKWEAEHAQNLVYEQSQGRILRWFYHPFTILLPGGVKYTPDFLCWLPTKRIAIHEVKWRGGKNAREGIAKLKIAAELYPWAEWVLFTKERGHWKETVI